MLENIYDLRIHCSGCGKTLYISGTFWSSSLVWDYWEISLPDPEDEDGDLATYFGHGDPHCPYCKTPLHPLRKD